MPEDEAVEEVLVDALLGDELPEAFSGNGSRRRAGVPGAESTAIALPGQLRDHMSREFENLQLKMDKKWEEERRERDKWNSEDKLEMHRVRITAMMAAAIISEGAVGTRPRSDQVADMAVEYADAVLARLRRSK